MKRSWVVCALCCLLVGCAPVQYANAQPFWLRFTLFVLSVVYLARLWLSGGVHLLMPSKNPLLRWIQWVLIHIWSSASIVLVPLSIFIILAVGLSVLSSAYHGTIDFFVEKMPAGGWTLLLAAGPSAIATTYVAGWFSRAMTSGSGGYRKAEGWKWHYVARGGGAGAEHSSATIRDVYDHSHGQGSWERSLKSQRKTARVMAISIGAVMPFAAIFIFTHSFGFSAPTSAIVFDSVVILWLTITTSIIAVGLD